jgi:DNA-binding LacI/PurR family transcriptional regulator
MKALTRHPVTPRMKVSAPGLEFRPTMFLLVGVCVLATLKDIAGIAGVTISTVSKAINGHTDINEETKTRILKIAHQLNYFDKKKADRPQTSRNYTIGIICPEIESNFYTQIVDRIEQRVIEKGYSLFIGLSRFDPQKESNYLNLMLNKRVDGIVLITCTDKNINRSLIEIRKKFDVPIIVVAVNQMVDYYDSIKIDDHLGVSIAINHLLELGHADIGYIGDQLSAHRFESFKRVLADKGTRFEEKWAKIGPERFEEGGYLRMNEMLKEKSLPSAIFASYDDIAIGAMRALHEKGIRIPQDVSIVGVDNIGVASYLDSSLTTISEPVNEMGDISCAILFSKIEKVKFTVIQNVVLKPELILRETTMRKDVESRVEERRTDG